MEHARLETQAEAYAVVEQAIRYLSEHYREQPPLAEVAAAVGLSEYHFQRLFTRWAGISPKRFTQALTVNYARRRLAESQPLLSTALEAGLSGPGRLHDLFVTHEAVTPGQYRRRGEGLTIAYGFHPSPFGTCLLGLSERGIVSLNFAPGDDRQPAYEGMLADWQAADFVCAPEKTGPVVEQIFAAEHEGPCAPLPVYLRGTNFQVKVWRALLDIPAGALASYSAVAARAGRPDATRAVATAIGSNPVSYLIPCHRVIRSSGAMSDYRWGRARKQALQLWEAARCGEPAPED